MRVSPPSPATAPAPLRTAAAGCLTLLALLGVAPATHAGVALDAAFLDGAVYVGGLAEFSGFDESAGGDSYGVTPRSRVFAGSGTTSSGPVRASSVLDMVIAPAGRDDRLAIDVTATGSAEYDGTAAGSGFAFIGANTFDDFQVVVDIDGPSAIGFAITGEGVAMRPVGSDVDLAGNGVLAPGDYTFSINRRLTEIEVVDSAVTTLTESSLQWRIVLSVPEPTTLALPVAGLGLYTRRRRRAGADAARPTR